MSEKGNESKGISRRRYLKYGAAGVVVIAAAGGAYYYGMPAPTPAVTPTVTPTLTPTATEIATTIAAATSAGPKYGGKVVLQMTGEPDLLNPMLSIWEIVESICGGIFDTLIRRDWEMNLSPGLAKSWDTSPDGKTITLQLEENVLWHDGQPFTSDDVVYTYSDLVPNYSPFYKAYFGNLESVEASGEHSVVFKLKAPNPDFLAHIAQEAGGVPMPKHLYAGTDVMKNPSNTNPVGTGPFKFVRWDKTASITLAKNPDYYVKGRPYLDTIVWAFIYDAAAAVAAFQAGTVDQLFGEQEPSELPVLQQIPDATVDLRFAPSQPFHKMQFNLRDPILKDTKVRQALYHATDISEIWEKIMFKEAVISTGPLSQGTFTKKFYTPDVQAYPLDVDNANKILDDAGYAKKSDGKRFQLQCVIPSSATWFIKKCELLRNQWSKIGVDLVNVAEEDTLFLQHVFLEWKFQVNPVWEYGGPTIGDALGYLHSSQMIKAYFTNNMGYSNQKVDQLLDSQAVETDANARISMVQQIQQEVMKDPPEIYLYTAQNMFPYKSKFHGLPAPPGVPGEHYDNIWVDQP